MKRSISYLCLSAAVCGASGTAPECQAESRAPAAVLQPDARAVRPALEEVRARIVALTQRLHVELAERDARAARLRDAELRITAKRRMLESVRAAAATAQRRRALLLTDERRARAALAAEDAALADEVRAAYLIGAQDELKLLLHQGDPAAAGRMATFYGYFARQRVARIADIQAQSRQVRDVAARLQQTANRLRVLETAANAELSGLSQARAERAAALLAMRARVSSATEELAGLEVEEQTEETLIGNLTGMLHDVPMNRMPQETPPEAGSEDPIAAHVDPGDSETSEDFAALRGKLPWPVPGRLSASHHDLRTHAAAPRWNGVLIESAHGAKVRAPYFGRVVYADWLQGLGLLLIVGHGDYMTLYGHAEVLYKSVGDWVAPGDVIAAMGDSGGAPAQLYFEIRNGRTPVDPKLWLKAGP